ncbi:MAG: hypothetical protein ABUS79_04345 [Pseudomonadota bacterium]
MKYVVEVAHLVNGDLLSVRRLSAGRERRGAWLAVLCVLCANLAAMTLAVAVVRATGRALFAPWFAGVWAVAFCATTAVAVAIVRRRLRRYVLGSRLECDAFASMDVDLVRRVGNRFDLTLDPGMRGHIESGRAPLPVEALVADGRRILTLEDGASAQLSVGTSTFVVRSRAAANQSGGVVADNVVDRARDLVRLFSRAAAVGVQLAFVGTLFCAVPSGATIGDRAAHLVAPRITTPWEAEKWLRIEAQIQSRSLHQCFDPLPLACQHPGYVGVGVSLTRDGEVRSNWIARSTYGQDCPVEQCVRDVVLTWVFDPLPEAMRVVLPVQVLRTAKPLPTQVAAVDSSGPRGPGGPVVDIGGGPTVQWQRER